MRLVNSAVLKQDTGDFKSLRHAITSGIGCGAPEKNIRRCAGKVDKEIMLVCASKDNGASICYCGTDVGIDGINVPGWRELDGCAGIGCCGTGSRENYGVEMADCSDHFLFALEGSNICRSHKRHIF